MQRNQRRLFVVALLAATSTLALTLAVSATPTDRAEPATGGDEVAQAAAVTHAVAVLHATEGNTVSGTVTFVQTEGGVQVTASLSGLSEGDHGFHIHQYGDCSAADGTSAGGHFNPAGMDHGGPDADVRHIGDLGNITADAEGNAQYERADAHLAFDGDHSIIGRGLIVHAGTDDLTSQPTGAAGARVACAVIGVAAGPVE